MSNNVTQNSNAKKILKISQHGANMHYCTKKDGDIEEDNGLYKNKSATKDNIQENTLNEEMIDKTLDLLGKAK